LLFTLNTREKQEAIQYLVRYGTVHHELALRVPGGWDFQIEWAWRTSSKIWIPNRHWCLCGYSKYANRV